MELSAALNDADATLKQPFRRAEYLLNLLGGPTAAEHKEMAPEFLEEMLELRMEIEHLRADPNPDSPGRQRMTWELTDRSEKLIAELRLRFALLDDLHVDSPKRKQTLMAIRQ